MAHVPQQALQAALAWKTEGAQVQRPPAPTLQCLGKVLSAEFILLVPPGKKLNQTASRTAPPCVLHEVSWWVGL